MILGEKQSDFSSKELLDPIATITENMDISMNDDPFLYPGIEEIKEIGQLAEVIYYDYSFPVYLELDNYSLVNLSLREDSIPYVKLNGVSEAEFFDLYTEKVRLTSGRTFTKNEIENGKNVVLVSKEWAVLNEVFINDTIDLITVIRSYENPEKFKTMNTKLEVIGFFEIQNYQMKENRGTIDYAINEENVLNDFYVPNVVSKRIFEERAILTSKFSINNFNLMENEGISNEEYLDIILEQDYYEPVFVLESKEVEADFYKKSSSILSSYPSYKILLNSGKYSYLTRNISNLPRIFLIVIFFSSVLCSLLFFIVVRCIKNLKNSRKILLFILILIMGWGGIRLGNRMLEPLQYELIYPVSREDGELQESLLSHQNHEEDDHEDEGAEWDQYAYRRMDNHVLTLSEVTKFYGNINSIEVALWTNSIVLTSAIFALMINIITEKLKLRATKNELWREK